MDMPKLGLAALIAKSFCITAAIAGSGISAGEADYTNHCAACHGVSGQGDGTVAEFLAIPSANLTLLVKNNGGKFPRDRASIIIDGRKLVRAHGVRNMPVWGDLFKYEEDGSQVGKGVSEVVIAKCIEDLVDYIQSIQEH